MQTQLDTQAEGALARSSFSILTPDQRLRVFVSSTLGELSEERLAVRDAISSLHLTPVMFELSARPHAPQALYRSYLDQSHVFIGIYWQSYGWVGPGMTVSGLEDEFQLGASKPRLLYMKSPASDRDPRLQAMIDVVRSSGDVAYRSFRTADELHAMVANDLAVLLTERFEASARSLATPTSAATESPMVCNVPATWGGFIGREREIEELGALLTRPDVRLVTLVGPGGTGKTRLAIEAVRRIEERFTDGIRYVPLASVTEADGVAPTIASALGLPASASSTAAIIGYVGLRQMLLVLDNFEQVVEAAPALSEIIRGCPSLRVLVTSRAVLRISGEHEFRLEPLELPDSGQRTFDDIAASDAVRLFVDRAQAARPDFRLTASNAAVVAEICRRLDGLPLAIELAAARARVLDPSAMLERLTKGLDFLSRGARDLPARQQTLRAMIEWSVGLLGESERLLFARLGVFSGGFSMDAAEEVCGSGLDVLDTLSVLVEQSLVQPVASADGSARYRMLETIREYAAALLDESAEATVIREAHTGFFQDFASGAPDLIVGTTPGLGLDLIDAEAGNLRATMRRSLDARRPADVAEMAWAMWPYWWARGNWSEIEGLMHEALAFGDELPPESRARASAVAGAAAFFQSDYEHADVFGRQTVMLAREHGMREPEVMALLGLSLMACFGPDPDLPQRLLSRAEEMSVDASPWVRALYYVAWGRAVLLQGTQAANLDEMRQAVDYTRTHRLQMLLAMTLNNIAAALTRSGLTDEALTAVREALQIQRSMRSLESMANLLQCYGAIEARRGDAERGARIFGMAEALGEAMGQPSWTVRLGIAEAELDRLRDALGDEGLQRAMDAGRALGFDHALRLVDELIHGDSPTAAAP